MLRVALDLPFDWLPGQPDDATRDAAWTEARLILRLALGQDAAAGREADRESALERSLHRLEVKLDLSLHLLAKLLDNPAAAKATRPIVLRPDGLELPARLATTVGAPGLCRLDLGLALPLALRLPATVSAADAERTQFAWPDMPDDILDLWSRWLFGLHRRAIQATHQVR